MRLSERAGEFTYYEELGVEPAASPEEIRDAYRALARLLHPDQHLDTQLKKVAEAQMRKFNRIYAVLSDPSRRRNYDEFLEEESSIIIEDDRLFPGPIARKRLGRVAWAAGILCGLGLLIWFTAETNPNPQARGPEAFQQAQPVINPSAAPAAGLQDQELIASLRSDLKAVKVERDAAIRELTRLRGLPSTPGSTEPSASETPEIRSSAIALTELPSPAKFPAASPSGTARIEKPSAGRKFAGFWFYAPPADGQHNKNQSLYLPEYIEATITEENGVLHGKYRARFRIVDRAISPEVNFTFSGNATNTAQATFPWNGAAGARGEITLKLVSDNSLRVDWNATELGTQQGLDTGTAVLTRRIE